MQKSGMGYTTIVKKHCEMVTMVGAIIQKWTKYKMTINRPEEEFVNDLKVGETTVNEITVGNTLCWNGLKSRKVPLLKKAHAQAHLKIARRHLNYSEKAREKVLMSDETKIEQQLSLLCLEKEYDPKHDPHSQVWRKHYALGMVFC